MKKPRPTMDKEVGRKVFQSVCQVLDYLNIPFFLIQGTALGAYRDGGFTPTERDIDIGFLQEDFQTHASDMESHFLTRGFETRMVYKPFSKPRALKLLWRGVGIGKRIKVDLCAYQRFQDKRFCSSNLEPYSIVHPAHVLESPYDKVMIFDFECNIPSPIETYLEHEYGPGWETPKDTHRSASRCYHFRQINGITDDFLNTQK